MAPQGTWHTVGSQSCGCTERPHKAASYLALRTSRPTQSLLCTSLPCHTSRSWQNLQQSVRVSLKVAFLPLAIGPRIGTACCYCTYLNPGLHAQACVSPTYDWEAGIRDNLVWHKTGVCRAAMLIEGYTCPSCGSEMLSGPTNASKTQSCWYPGPLDLLSP